MKPLPLLDHLLSPADLRKMTAAQLKQLAEEIRHRIKETVSTHGGHLASNLGTVELTLALHRVFDFSSDRLLWDVGHQAYPHKLVTGRATRFDSNRQRGGLSGFPDPKESPWDLAKVGHSSTAISTGVGVAEGYKRLGHQRRTVVVVGDGALTGGMSFEGLINAGQLKSDLIVVLNDNGTFIDAPTGSLHTHLDRIRTGDLYKYLHTRFKRTLQSLPRGHELERLADHIGLSAHKLITPGYIFEDLGFAYFGPVDGHNLPLLEDSLRRLTRRDGPILLHVMTKKGGGWAPAAADPLKFHGPKGFDLDTGFFHPKAPSGRSYSQVFAETLAELAQEDPSLVAITAAMPSGTALRQFGQAFPDRVYDVGICEQHSFGFAEGLAIAGLRPVVAHYSTFAQRGFDQLFQEVVLQRDLGVVVALDRAGLVGEDGETHHGLYDLSWTRCLPGLVLMAPKDGIELRAMLRWSHQERQKAERAAGYVIRYPRDEAPELGWGLDRSEPIALGKAELIRQGDGPLMVWAYGAMVVRAWQALELLGDEGRGITLVNARFAKPLDGDLLVRLARKHRLLLSLEDHCLPGGFGSILCETCADRHLPLEITRLGVSDELVPHASREQQLNSAGLDPTAIATTMHRLITGTAAAIPFTRAG